MQNYISLEIDRTPICFIVHVNGRERLLKAILANTNPKPVAKEFLSKRCR